ncbi:MAG: hypothetical protein Kow00105_02250 [Phycisphaeraceae bacterium]
MKYHRLDIPLRFTAVDIPGWRGFTLVEAVMSILIVGLMLVAALNTVGASKVAQARQSEQVQGPMLAQDLLAEILSESFEEPVDTPGFGRESGESGGDRADWDDVDDYDGWSGSPPQAKDGTELPGLSGWERTVKVSWAVPNNPDLDSATATGIKKVTVTVRHQGRVVATLISLRSNAWPTTFSGSGGNGVSLPQNVQGLMGK